MDPWVEIVARRLGPPIFTTSDEVRFNCWRSDCGASSTPDTKYHLYLNPIKDKFFCQRCQRGGTLAYLTKVLGLPPPDQTLGMWESILHTFLFGSGVPDKLVEVELPPSSQIYPGMKAFQYLTSRNISESKISHYGLRAGIKEQINRILIPDVDSSGRLVYWVARTYGNHKAKYRNATAPREYQVFNLGRLESKNHKGRLVICEGTISSISAGYDSVATYGKYVTGEQVQRLVDFNADEYVIAFDGDAVLEGVSLATRLHRRRCNVKFVEFDYHEDPNSIDGFDMRRRIHSALRWHELAAAQLLLKFV